MKLLCVVLGRVYFVLAWYTVVHAEVHTSVSNRREHCVSKWPTLPVDNVCRQSHVQSAEKLHEPVVCSSLLLVFMYSFERHVKLLLVGSQFCFKS